jgi:hypothetical protein
VSSEYSKTGIAEGKKTTTEEETDEMGGHTEEATPTRTQERGGDHVPSRLKKAEKCEAPTGAAKQVMLHLQDKA